MPGYLRILTDFDYCIAISVGENKVGVDITPHDLVSYANQYQVEFLFVYECGLGSVPHTDFEDFC